MTATMEVPRAREGLKMTLRVAISNVTTVSRPISHIQLSTPTSNRNTPKDQMENSGLLLLLVEAEVAHGKM